METLGLAFESCTATRVAARRIANLAAGALALACGFGAARADAQPALPAPSGERIEIASCATGPGLSIGLADARAVLADEERSALLGEVRLRYPILANDGFDAAVFLLWHKTPREWLYVSLQPQRGDGTLCFTASFTAEQFSITPTVMNAHAL